MAFLNRAFIITVCGMVAGIFFLIGSQGQVWAADPEPRFHNLSIVVSSCDKYEEFWNPFFALLYKRWPSLKTTNSHVPIYLIVGKKTYVDPRVTVIQTDPSKSWSAGLRQTLESVKTDYVIYIQEDFFLVLDVDEGRLSQLFDFFREEKAVRLQMGPYYLYDSIPHPKMKGVAFISKTNYMNTYGINCETALWNRKEFLNLLAPEESPWEFERNVNKYRRKQCHGLLLVVYHDSPFSYLNGSVLGYWDGQVFEYLQSMGVVGERTLPIMEEHPWVFWVRKKMPLLHGPFWWFKGLLGQDKK